MHGIGYIRPDQSESFQSFPDLLDKAKRTLAGLQRIGMKPGDKAIISLDNSSEIIPALWACFMGGIIPALLQPPVSFTEHNPAAEKAEKVFRLLENPQVILSHSHFEAWLNSGIQRKNLVDLADVPLDHNQPGLPSLNTSALAMIQFSSGSTGDPKGVMLSHHNIISNLADIIRGIRLIPEDHPLTWMPLYHDMGLIGFHFTPLYTGCSQYFIEPADFIKNPFLWLDQLSVKKSTVIGCPNFGQALVNRYISRKKKQSWDFSSIRVVFNGAEPISVPTMYEFIAHLSPFGFRAEAMLPAYGMAEATLAVTFPALEAAPEVISYNRMRLLREGIAQVADPGEEDVIRLVNLGRPLNYCAVEVRDETGAPLPADRVGQVLVKGENVTQGYYNDPEATAQAWSGTWLKTGDLGFLHDGDLFIMGRSKDIIFVNGANYYSHDLEAIALEVPGVSTGKIVMAGYFDEAEGRDKVITFLVGPDSEGTRSLFQEIRQHFLNTLGLALDLLIPIRSGDIPRTSSGKLQRYKMVSRFLKDEFPAVVRI